MSDVVETHPLNHVKSPQAQPTRANPLIIVHYGVTIFLSAFLLFQVQPIMGKLILPWFGGSASVWTTCMLFFQMLLLLGYGYSHVLAGMRSAKLQSAVHAALIVASLICLPLSANPAWRPTGEENPTLRILILLVTSIGLPYLVLSTTGPLVQSWFGREKSSGLPYRLFALSNLGALIALLGYPALVEPELSARSQSLVWSGLFLIFAASCGMLAWRGRRGEVLHATITQQGAGPSIGRKASWILLASCPSILLLADTSFLTENVAPIPMLWIAPLALYLLSFILCFEGKRWYSRIIFAPALLLALASMAYVPTLGLNAMPVVASISLNLICYFVVCMACHGELADLKPDTQYLTSFYLMLAIGGACGGLFVGIVAPYAFAGNYEYSIGLVLTGVVMSIVLLRRVPKGKAKPVLFLVVTASLCAITLVRVNDHLADRDQAILLARNFYGAQAVYDVGSGDDQHRTLMHGQIIHGKQYTNASHMDEPLTYYSHGSGVGRVLLSKAADGPSKVGLVGLGAGTLAIYGRAGDHYRIYEIDPLVVSIAHDKFTFLAHSRAELAIKLGDARLTLDKEADQQFDVLAIDAFSGDSVPVHLMTREAFATYFRHLKPDGVLVLHVTNRFLDLPPIVEQAAKSLGKTTRVIETEGDHDHEIYHSTWAVVANKPEFFERPGIREFATAVKARPNAKMWTDDYSSVFSVLK